MSEMILLFDDLIFNSDNSRSKMIVDDDEVKGAIFGLLNSFIETKEYDINILFNTNLAKLPLKTKNLKNPSGNSKEKKQNKCVVVNTGSDFYFNCVVNTFYFLSYFKNLIFSVNNVDPLQQKYLYNFQRMFAYISNSERRYFSVEPKSELCRVN